MYQTYLEDATTDEFVQNFVDSNWLSYELNTLNHLVEYKREDAVEMLRFEQSKMKTLLQRIPDFYKPTDYKISEYLNLLDRILEDRLITDEEFDEIEEFATQNSISSKKLNDIHEEYYRRLVRYYLSDKVLSETELLDLEKVASLLQIDDETRNTIVDLERAELEVGNSASSSAENKYDGASVCFTGQLSSRLKGRLIDRELAHSLAIENGLVVKKGVSKKLDLLVVADPNSQSSKARKARNIGVKVVAEAVFWRDIGLSVE